MKKLVNLLLVGLVILSLSGCTFIESFLEEETITVTVILSEGGESGDETITLTLGESVTVSTTPQSGYSFKEWVNAETLEPISTQNPYTFTPTDSMTIQATFNLLESFNFNVRDNYDLNSVHLNQENPLLELSTVTITADDVEGYDFEHFLDLDTLEILTFENQYTTSVYRNKNIEAIYSPSDEYHLYIYTNISKQLGEDTLHRDIVTVKKGEMVTLMSEENSAYTFKHYLDFLDETIISTDALYTFTPEDSMVIVSTYHALLAPRQTYFTGFDDVTKSSYAEDTVTTNEKSWLLKDALLGALDNDRFEEARAVRLNQSDESLLQSEFKASNLNRITFKAAIYGDDALDDLSVYVSTDKTDWTLVDTIFLTHTLSPYTIDFENPEDYYIRFVGSASRINIDSIALFEELYETPNLPLIIAPSVSITFPYNSTKVTLEFDDTFSEFVSYNEPFNANSCVAVDETLGEFNCEVYGEVNTSVLGEYPITFYFLDSEGNYASESVTIVVLKDASVMDIDYTGYYDGLEGLYGEDLLEALRVLINRDVTRRSYEEAKTILAESDVDPDDDTKVLTIYSRDSVNRTWDSTSWHREHVWPNSRLGVTRVTESQRNIASDLHNLRAIVPSINSSRSNRFFDIESDVTSLSFYPGSDDEGDVFRILMYMITMYPELELINEILENDPETNYTLEGAKLGKFSAIIHWHYADPVDAFESHRNDIIYSYQNNRNPFIDHPHFVELILFDNPYLPLS
ncbi:MAG: endonuclease [Candidatus Izemoplasmataceae bacterium]